MAGKIVKGAAAGAGLGTALGTALPGLGNAVGAVVGSIGGAVVGVFEGVFSSKKHYHLYYFEVAEGVWKFVMDGHPSQVKPVAKQYTSSGIPVAIVRNKGDKSADGTLAPKEPPTGYKSATPTSTNYLMIAALLFMVGIAVYFLFIKRKRKK